MSRPSGIPWMTVEDVLAATGGSLVRGAAGTGLTFRGCAIDSRTIQDGELFVPLPGSNVDGHAFVASALEGLFDPGRTGR